MNHGGDSVKYRMVVALAFLVPIALFGGCRDASDNMLGTENVATSQAVVSDSPGETQARGVDARLHADWQIVELVDPSGAVSTGAFRADYTVVGGGRAAGSFAIESDAGMDVYRITGGSVRCVGGEDVVVLTAMPSGTRPEERLSINIQVTPVGGDDPDCIIWDIRDGCSHEAQSKHEILAGACVR